MSHRSKALVLAALLLAMPPGFLRAAERMLRVEPAAFPVQPVTPVTPAPDIALSSLDGQPLRLADLRGRIVLVNFWATWCVPCVAELPDLVALRDALRGEQFTLLAVNVMEPPSRVRDFLSRHAPTLVPHVDASGAVFRAFAAPGLPTSYVLDSEGRVVGRIVGKRAWASEASLAYMRQQLPVPGRSP